jgi:hypothetical protein
MDAWEKLLKDGPAIMITPADRYELAMAHYGFIGYCLDHEQKQRASPYMDLVEVIVNKLVKDFPDDPRYIALRGALYGFRFIYDPQKILVIGPKALKTVNQALKMGPECPQAWIETGNKDWWMPEIFGGSRLEALADYEKAIRMMERDPDFIRGNWYYLSVNMVLANWYEQCGRTYAAREICRKMVTLEPEFEMARQKLDKK